MRRILSLIALAVMLVGCGGGGTLPDPSAIPVRGSLDYIPVANPRHSYTPYSTWSHVSWWDAGDVQELYIGGDWEPQERLRLVFAENGLRYYFGASRDGVGVDRVRSYEKDLLSESYRNGFRPFSVQPTLYFDPDLLLPRNGDLAVAVYEGIQIVNDALPPEFQLVGGGVVERDVTRSGEIFVMLESPAGIGRICGAGSAACAVSETSATSTSSAIIYLPDDLDASEFTYTRTVIVHELLHALGIQGHVDSIEFPDSILGTHGNHIPNPGHIISKVDREALQIMYMNQRTDLYNDWGEWSDVAHHAVGRTDDEALNFGVALFNGLPQPWARGTAPDMALEDNRLLRGTATWTGNLLAFSGTAPLAGDAELRVNVSTLSVPDSVHDLRFRDIYFVNRFESTSSDRWFSTRNIDYKVSVTDNFFLNAGDEQDFVTGAFFGDRHEHMGGTLKRTDMVGAFGGSR